MDVELGQIWPLEQPRPGPQTDPAFRTQRVGPYHRRDDTNGRRQAPGFDHQDLQSRGRESFAVFTIQPRTGIVCIKIVDALTREIIRQIPADEIVQFADQAQAYLDAARTHAGRR